MAPTGPRRGTTGACSTAACWRAWLRRGSRRRRRSTWRPRCRASSGGALEHLRVYVWFCFCVFLFVCVVCVVGCKGEPEAAAQHVAPAVRGFFRRCVAHMHLSGTHNLGRKAERPYALCCSLFYRVSHIHPCPKSSILALTRIPCARTRQRGSGPGQRRPHRGAAGHPEAAHTLVQLVSGARLLLGVTPASAAAAAAGWLCSASSQPLFERSNAKSQPNHYCKRLCARG